MESPPKRRTCYCRVSVDVHTWRRKNLQEWDPEDVLEERTEEALVSQTILEQREANVTRAEEDDGDSDPDLGRVHVKSVDGELKAEEDVVDHADRRRRRDTVSPSFSHSKEPRGDSNLHYENM
jgi:hypothetical protein